VDATIGAANSVSWVEDVMYPRKWAKWSPKSAATGLCVLDILTGSHGALSVLAKCSPAPWSKAARWDAEKRVRVARRRVRT
jgi:hypothetical protein